MSEYGSLYVTTCDKCTLEARSLVPLFEMVSRMPSSVRGVFYGGFDLAQIHAGWEERDYGHICPDCAREEKEEVERDETGQAVSGALWKEDLPGATDAVDDKLKAEVELAVQRVNEAIGRGVMPEAADMAAITDFYDLDSLVPEGPLSPAAVAEAEEKMQNRLHEIGVKV